MSSGVLDTNVVGATAALLSGLTTEKLITVTVSANTGTHDNHCIVLDTSPDEGTTWEPLPPPIIGTGILINTVGCTDVRVKVTGAEGAPSTCNIHILAR